VAQPRPARRRIVLRIVAEKDEKRRRPPIGSRPKKGNEKGFCAEIFLSQSISHVAPRTSMQADSHLPPNREADLLVAKHQHDGSDGPNSDDASVEACGETDLGFILKRSRTARQLCDFVRCTSAPSALRGQLSPLVEQWTGLTTPQESSATSTPASPSHGELPVCVPCNGPQARCTIGTAHCSDDCENFTSYWELPASSGGWTPEMLPGRANQSQWTSLRAPFIPSSCDRSTSEEEPQGRWRILSLEAGLYHARGSRSLRYRETHPKKSPTVSEENHAVTGHHAQIPGRPSTRRVSFPCAATKFGSLSITSLYRTLKVKYPQLLPGGTFPRTES